MNNFSPNMLKTFDECQQKFFLKYVEKISVPLRSAIFEKGKKIHALANYFLKGENIEKMEKALNADEKATWESLKNNKYFKFDVVNTEYSLSCKIGEYWVGGRLDALVKMENGKWEMENSNSSPVPLTAHSPRFTILDYKTGNIPQNAENDFQTIVYLLCADKLLNKKGGYEELMFVYLGLKANEERQIVFNDDLKKLYEERIIKTCKDIEFAINTKVFEKNQDKCERCEYKKLCKER